MRPAKRTTAASTSACPSAERPTMRAKRSSHSGASRSGREAAMALPPPLRGRLGHQADARQARVVHRPHDAHHLAVRHGLIGAHVELAVGTRRRDRGELGGELLGRHGRVVQVELPALPHVHDQLLLLPAERAGGHLRQVDRHALLEDRRGHHEDDEQHQHHVDERRDVDLRDRLGGGRALVEGHLRKCRSAMLRNSDAKVSISDVSTRTWRAKRLYITTAGMAAARPTAVATSASAMPGATAWMLELVVTERPRNAVMIPHTVPKRPMNGAVLAVVARKVRPRSRRVTSCVRARAMARCTFSMPPNSATSSSPPGFPRFALVSRCSSWYPPRNTWATVLSFRSTRAVWMAARFLACQKVLVELYGCGGAGGVQ